MRKFGGDLTRYLGHVPFLGDSFAEFNERYGEELGAREELERALQEFVVWWHT